MATGRYDLFGDLTFLYIALMLTATAAISEAADVVIHLQDPPLSGTVSCAVFDSPNTFSDRHNAVRIETFELDGSSDYFIRNLPPGEYAIMAYYDENGNGQLDKNFIGIPREPVGFSNEYRPKGPPRFQRAAFRLDEKETKPFQMRLYSPLGKRGRLGLGIGVIARSSPYREYDSGVYQAIPAFSYNGKRVQLFGPNVQVGLLGTGDLRLAAKGTYRIGVYDEDESAFLAGMGDREDTFMSGLAVLAELPAGMDLAASYEHDMLDRIGGGAARISIDKSFEAGPFKVAPEIGLNWMSEELANHDFGVPTAKAKPNRPAYELDDLFSIEISLGVFTEISRDWLLIVRAGIERLGNEATDSPLVSEDYVAKGFVALNYLFGE